MESRPGKETQPDVDFNALVPELSLPMSEHAVVRNNWRSVLTSKDILTGYCGASWYSEVLAEYCHPDFICRQFSLTQYVPLPYQYRGGLLRLEGITNGRVAQIIKDGFDRVNDIV